MNINRYICTGRLTRDPELKQLPSATNVCELRLAVEGMAGAGEPGFINVSVFGKPGEAAAEYLRKGWLVAVDGRLSFREWETDAGQKRRDYTIVGSVEFLSPPRPTAAEGKPARRRREPVAA